MPGFDFSTPEVLDWEVRAIWAAMDADELRVSRHAREELGLDALTIEDVFDAIGYFDEVSKDLPENTRGRAPGINFDRHLGLVRLRVKVGWRDVYYVVITVMAN